jgi:predicted Zn-dependent protease
MLGMLKALIALIFITFVAAIVAGIYFIKFDNSSEIGSYLKSYVIKNPQFISIFNLNQPGDNRFTYVSSKYPNLKVNVAYTYNNQPDKDVQNWIKKMILDSIGKNAEINYNSKPTIVTQEKYTDQDLNRIRREIESGDNSPIPVINVVYLTSYQNIPSYVGVTLHRDTIFIFKKTIAGMTSDIGTLQRLEESTLIHEWGHLLGLSHIKEPGCIMSDFLESYIERSITSDEVPLEQCWGTTYELDQLKKQAQ